MKWNIHKITENGGIGSFLDSGNSSQGRTPEEALEAAANGKAPHLYQADSVYFVTPNRGVSAHITQVLDGAKILRLEVPPAPLRVAKPVTF